VGAGRALVAGTTRGRRVSPAQIGAVVGLAEVKEVAVAHHATSAPMRRPACSAARRRMASTWLRSARPRAARSATIAPDVMKRSAVGGGRFRSTGAVHVCRSGAPDAPRCVPALAARVGESTVKSPGPRSSPSCAAGCSCTRSRAGTSRIACTCRRLCRRLSRFQVPQCCVHPEMHRKCSFGALRSGGAVAAPSARIQDRVTSGTLPGTPSRSTSRPRVPNRERAAQVPVECMNGCAVRG
jgi:hypothetical protein